MPRSIPSALLPILSVSLLLFEHINVLTESIEIYNVALAFSPVVRHEYAARHDGHLPQVRWNDIAFAAHVRAVVSKLLLLRLNGFEQAFVISSITLIQTFVYLVSCDCKACLV